MTAKTEPATKAPSVRDELQRLVDDYDFEALFASKEFEYKRLAENGDFVTVFKIDSQRHEELLDGFEHMIEVAALLDYEIATAIWITRVRQQSALTVKQREYLAYAFPAALRKRRATTARAAKDALLPPIQEAFLYDGTPLARQPKVIVVPPDAGRTPVGTGYGKARELKDAQNQKDRDADIQEGVRILGQFVHWLDRREGSSMDMRGWVDFHARAAEAHVESKRTYLMKLNAELRAIERLAKLGEEIDQHNYDRITRTRERVIMSGHMLADVAQIHHIVRTNTYGMLGEPMDSFRSWSQMKKDKDQYHQLKLQTILADNLVGMTPDELRAVRKAHGYTPEGVLSDFADTLRPPEGGGVDALPDEPIAASLRDAMAIRERNRRREVELSLDAPDYKRNRRRRVPKASKPAWPELGDAIAEANKKTG